MSDHPYSSTCGCPGCQFLWAAEETYKKSGPAPIIGTWEPKPGDLGRDCDSPNSPIRIWISEGRWYPSFEVTPKFSVQVPVTLTHDPVTEAPLIKLVEPQAPLPYPEPGVYWVKLFSDGTLYREPDWCIGELYDRPWNGPRQVKWFILARCETVLPEQIQEIGPHVLAPREIDGLYEIKALDLADWIYGHTATDESENFDDERKRARMRKCRAIADCMLQRIGPQALPPKTFQELLEGMGEIFDMVENMKTDNPPEGK